MAYRYLSIWGRTRREKNKAEFKGSSAQLQPGWARQDKKLVGWMVDTLEQPGGNIAPEEAVDYPNHATQSWSTNAAAPFPTYKANKTTPRPVPILQYHMLSVVQPPRRCMIQAGSLPAPSASLHLFEVAGSSKLAKPYKLRTHEF